VSVGHPPGDGDVPSFTTRVGDVGVEILAPEARFRVRTRGRATWQGRAVGEVEVVSRARGLLNVLHDHEGLGRTGETLLGARAPDGEVLLLTPARFDPAAALRRTVPGDSASAPLVRALRGEAGLLEDVRDYRDHPVLAATALLDEYDWAIVTKVDRDEVFAPVEQVTAVGAGSLALVALAVTTLAAATGRRLTAPLARLTRTATRIAGGDLARRARVRGDDEVSRLADAFNRMTDSLVTKSRQEETARRHLDAVVESASSALLEIDTEGTILWANAEAERLFGHPREALRGQPVEILVPERHREEHAALRDAYTGDPESRSMGRGRDLFALRADGDEVPVEIGLSPIRGEERVTVLASVVDLTERKRSEARLKAYADELERSNRELDEFAYVASHDLKTPLRGIDQLSRWLQEDLGPRLSGESARYLDQLRIRVRRLENLLDDLLQYSRAGRSAGQVAEVDVGELLEAVVELLEPPPERFRVECRGDFPVLMTERAPLEQVFVNLIGNAIKHHDRSEGCVRVECADAGDFVEFCVADDGPGIDPRFHQRIFRMFQTLRPRDEVEGSGIGLALVQRIVESRGGRVRIESEPGRGAAFRFTWPRRIEKEPAQWPEENTT